MQLQVASAKAPLATSGPGESVLQSIKLIVPLLNSVGGARLWHDFNSKVCHLSRWRCRLSLGGPMAQAAERCSSYLLSLLLARRWSLAHVCSSDTPLWCSIATGGMPTADTASGGISTATGGGPFHLPFPLPSGHIQHRTEHMRASPKECPSWPCPPPRSDESSSKTLLAEVGLRMFCWPSRDDDRGRGSNCATGHNSHLRPDAFLSSELLAAGNPGASPKSQCAG